MTLLATDPPVSEKQRRAMHAAASGHSTLGIPKWVGQEFVGKDGAREGAGVLFATADGLGLFVRRSSTGDHAGEWCLPGGALETGEDATTAATREALEEIGDECPISDEMYLAHRAVSDEDVDFSTFVQPVGDHFVPSLSGEHTAYSWAPILDPPQPLHPGVGASLKHMTDARQATDEAILSRIHMGRGAETELAFDRASVRRYDVDGRLHVERAHISKANVCEYLGQEIPGWKDLGLDPDRKYRLLRDPEELARAASTFNNLPILDRHVPVSAESHAPEFVVGSTGTDAAFADPHLDNSLVIWAGPAIQSVESEDQKELSCAYRYRPDMTPGSFKGEQYDGVMRDIVGNHVALVKEGRAGDDVVVGDSKENLHMAEKKKVVLTPIGLATVGALAVYLGPKLAQDAKFTNSQFRGLVDGVNRKNFAERKPQIVKSVTDLLKGKLAKDASLTDMPGVLDALQATTDPSSGALPMSEFRKEGMDNDDPAAYHHPVIEFLKTLGLPDEAVAKVQAMLEQEEMSGDEPPPFLEKPKDPAKDADPARGTPPPGKQPTVDASDPDKEKKDEHAMDEKMKKVAEDAASEATVKATKIQQGIRDAERAVRPWVGELALSFDSAEGVFMKALEMTGGVPKDVTASAGTPVLRAILETRRKPSDKPTRDPAVALDAAGAKTYADNFPGASRIGVA